jgi:integrase
MSTKIVSSEKNDVLAQKKLAAFELDLMRGKSPAPSLKIGALLDDVLNDYTVNAKKTADGSKERIEKHLRPWFGDMRPEGFGADDWREYVAVRQTQAKNATINRERSLLLRGFALAKQAGKIDAVPYIPRLKEAAPRAGFVDRAELESLCRHLPSYLANATRFAFLTGWRLGEIRGLQWRHIDFEHGEIRLDPGSTKNDEGRVFPMTSELRDLLSALSTAADTKRHLPETACTRVVNTPPVAALPAITPWVFQFRGQPIGFLYHSWGKAARAIGKPGLLFHDLRRSFVREQRLRGMSENEIMKLTGHKTRAIFDRYTIINEGDLDRLRQIMECAQSVRSEGKSSRQ